jgi:hypothetical protein
LRYVNWQGLEKWPSLHGLYSFYESHPERQGMETSAFIAHRHPRVIQQSA